MRELRATLAALCVCVLAGCSGGEPEENVFKAQTDAIGKAEDVNKLIEDAADKQRQAIDATGD